MSLSSKLRREALLNLVLKQNSCDEAAIIGSDFAFYRRFMRSVELSGIKIGSFFVLDRRAILGCVAITFYYSINMFINFGR